uniref:Addiction module component n=1 Tax=Candidatus Kentrum sp. FM TaxID=2126340 RepID=A0A450W9D3_9GAMM|nr:MAG: Putative addiction module component [Candidatus Kentron sp. FM]VFJ73932.1 MAG: Putative addiction module component [Candidatus Kentron sp. FM]VFK13625.1 MAG: Putative addiction module component [Candidatus Kentron sp. FM]
MNIAIPLKTITTTDKLRAIEEIQADLVRDLDANESEDIPSLAWHADILRDRERRIADGTSRFLDIPEAKQAVRGQLK